MAKNVTYFILLLSLLLVSNCSICSSIKARKLLSNCSFNIKSVEIKDVMQNSNDVYGLINQFVLGNTQNAPKMDFNVVVEVENPNDEKVLIDSLMLNLIVHDDSLSQIFVNEYIQIEPNTKKDVPITVSVPINLNILKASTAKEFTLAGTVWMKFEFFSGFSPVFAVPVEMTETL